jgi:hypothetical protein
MTTRRRWLVRTSIALLIASGAAVGLYVLATVPPTDNPFYPKCMSYTVFGLHCPGCGLTRAAHALLNGQVRQSLAYNLWLLPALAYFSLISLRWGWQWAWGLPRKSWKWPTFLVWIGVTLFLLYGVVRNIPIEPFNWLAPHRLTE